MRRLFLVLVFLSVATSAGAFWVEDNFFMSNADLSGTTYYIGYKTTQGGWYIKALDTTNANQFRVSYSYVPNNTDYSHHWTNRDSLSGASAYQVFDDAF